MNRVEPNRNVYVGHRYVPLLVGEWDKSIQYEGLSIVTFQGASYTSKKMTPAGIDISNDEYWVLTGNYDAQVEYYRMETERVAEELKTKADKSELEDFQVTINQQITDFEQSTNQKFSDFESQINQTISDFENSINTRVDDFEQSTNTKLDDHKNELNESIASVLQEIEQVGTTTFNRE